MQVLAVQQKEDRLKKQTKDLQAERDQVHGVMHTRCLNVLQSSSPCFGHTKRRSLFLRTPQCMASCVYS